MRSCLHLLFHAFLQEEIHREGLNPKATFSPFPTARRALNTTLNTSENQGLFHAEKNKKRGGRSRKRTSPPAHPSPLPYPYIHIPFPLPLLHASLTHLPPLCREKHLHSDINTPTQPSKAHITYYQTRRHWTLGTARLHNSNNFISLLQASSLIPPPSSVSPLFIPSTNIAYNTLLHNEFHSLPSHPYRDTLPTRCPTLWREVGNVLCFFATDLGDLCLVSKFRLFSLAVPLDIGS